MKISTVIMSVGRASVVQAQESASESDEVITIVNPKQQAVDNANDGYKRTTGDVIVFIGDRVRLRPGWRKATEAGFEKIGGSGVVSFWSNIVIYGAVSRDWCQKYQMDNLWWPEYIHYYFDLEMGERARGMLQYTEVLDQYDLEPRKPFKDDEKGEDMVQWDKKVYYDRQKLGFPSERTVSLRERKKHIYIPTL